MPSLQTARRVANAKNNGAKTIGQIYKEESDWAMEQTWDNDIQSKICYSSTIGVCLCQPSRIQIQIARITTNGNL